MNAPHPLFLNAVRTARFAAVAGAALSLAACSTPFGSAKVDPASPVAGDVARMTRANTDYPSFSEIPPIPGDVRPLAMFGEAANELKLIRAQLERETAPETWTLSGTEAFVDRALRDAPDEPPSERAQDPEAFARELRERATPPPPR